MGGRTLRRGKQVWCQCRHQLTVGCRLIFSKTKNKHNNTNNSQTTAIITKNHHQQQKQYNTQLEPPKMQHSRIVAAVCLFRFTYSYIGAKSRLILFCSKKITWTTEDRKCVIKTFPIKIYVKAIFLVENSNRSVLESLRVIYVSKDPTFIKSASLVYIDNRSPLIYKHNKVE